MELGISILPAVTGLTVALLAAYACDLAADPAKIERQRIALETRSGGLRRALLAVPGAVGRLAPAARLHAVSERLGVLGPYPPLTAGEYVGTQCLGALALLGVSLGLRTPPWASLTCLLAGWLYPEAWLMERTRSRRSAVRADLPLAVDILAICVSAGLGLDQAVERATDALGRGPLKEELTHLLDELRVGQTRVTALRGLAARVMVPEISTLTAALIQADHLGTSVARTLPLIADQVRATRSVLADEAAAKAPIKLLFPLLVFIFPCVLILVMAPVMLSGALSL